MHLLSLLSVLSVSGILPLAFARSLQISTLYGSNVRTQLTSSPLQVELRNTQEPGKIQAVITNRGIDTAYFSTWRNILSKDDEARKVDVLDVQRQAVTFLNAEGLPTTLDIPEDYEKLAAGTSITRDIDITSNYELEAGKEYFVQAGGFIPYRLEDEKWTKSAAIETNIVSFTAPRDTHIQVAVKGNYILQACEDPVLMQKLNSSLVLTAQVAKKVSEYTAKGENKAAFVAYFKEDTPENRKKVADRYAAIYKTLTDKQGPTKIGCRAQCTGYYAIGAAWTGPTTGKTELCPAMKTYPAELRVCNRMNWPGVLIHELSHSGILFRPSTNDKAQGPQQCKALTAQQALVNADTFNMYAQSVYLDKVC